MKKIWFFLFSISLATLIQAAEDDSTYIVPLIESAQPQAVPGRHIYCNCGGGMYKSFESESQKATTITKVKQTCLTYITGLREADITCSEQPKYEYYCLSNWHYDGESSQNGLFTLSSLMPAPSLTEMKRLMKKTILPELGHLINCYPSLPNRNGELDHLNAIFDDFNHKCRQTLAITCNDRAQQQAQFMNCVRNSPHLRSDPTCKEFFGLN